jgi:hypothetical protein
MPDLERSLTKTKKELWQAPFLLFAKGLLAVVRITKTDEK